MDKNLGGKILEGLLNDLKIPVIIYDKKNDRITVNLKAYEVFREESLLKDHLNKIYNSFIETNTHEHAFISYEAGQDSFIVAVFKIGHEDTFLVMMYDLNNHLHELQKINPIKTEWDYILESLHEDILITDERGVILKVSPSFQEIYGVNDKDVIGKTVYEMERIGIFQPSVTANVLKTGNKATMLQKNKYGRQIVVTATPIKNTIGKIVKVISFSRDITDYINLKEQYSKLENKIQRYTAELEELRNKAISIPGVIGKSKNIQEVLKTISKVADFDTNILFTGESGVGKTLFAKITHSQSKRSKGSFIEINCGTIPENLLESELFGYEGGSFTGAKKQGKMGLIELAHNGTLFLDEISELSVNLQVKLLKVIQDKSFIRVGGTTNIRANFRLIAATNKDLRRLVDNKMFREDLFYRLNVITMNIPPLRDRKDDIFPLTLYFLDTFNKKYNLNRTIDPSALDLLMSYKWPGNIRELENVIERAMITSEHDIVTEECLPKALMAKPSFVIGREDNTLAEAIDDLEKEMILKATAKYKTTVGVAQALGISQPTAARKMKKYLNIIQ